MPTTYTHDLFGKRVFQSLPEDMKCLIRRHKNLFRIGLHGPDIFFYYLVSKNPVSQYGVRMHNMPAADFFERGMRLVRERQDDALCAYLLGFGCHYILDSTSHPYVNRMDAEKIVSHTVLEKEFDRFLMEKTGKDPYSFRPSDAIVPEYRYAKVIHRAVPQVKTINILLSLYMQKLLTNLMICSDGGRRKRLVRRLLSLGGEEGIELSEHFMSPEPPEGIEEALEKMSGLFRQSLKEAPDILEELWELKKVKRPLSQRWHRTYQG